MSGIVLAAAGWLLPAAGWLSGIRAWAAYQEGRSGMRIYWDGDDWAFAALVCLAWPLSAPVLAAAAAWERLAWSWPRPLAHFRRLGERRAARAAWRAQLEAEGMAEVEALLALPPGAG